MSNREWLLRALETVKLNWTEHIWFDLEDC